MGKLFSRTAALACTLAASLSFTAVPANALDADGWVFGKWTMKYSSSPSNGYTSQDRTSTNRHRGYNFYFGAANHEVPGGYRTRWVKCGVRSTVDYATRVGGQSVVTEGYTIATRLGTNFRSGTCVYAASRPVSYLGYGEVVHFEQYFNSYPIP